MKKRLIIVLAIICVCVLAAAIFIQPVIRMIAARQLGKTFIQARVSIGKCIFRPANGLSLFDIKIKRTGAYDIKLNRADIQYGLFSIRELITNAVCHRDYSEQGTKVIIKMFSGRIEYYNPGGLVKDITAKNIADKQFSRNPVITKVLAKVKYIEELGEGWNKIIDENKKHPMKPKMPEIDADKYTVLVKLFSAGEKLAEPELKYELDVGKRKRIEMALQYVRERGSITNAEYQKINGVSRETATRDLKELVGSGIIMTTGKGKRGLRYLLAQKPGAKMAQKKTQK